MTRPPNRLASESSPYLRQHAHNPVDWYPWGAEAFARAKAEDKPVFLSVGYSSCHWCHVMEHESFERDDVAELLNRHFISIKVDREEQPDLDALYMTATQLVTQRGGWPNSLWLTPDGRPWYAGTYFPREDRHGRIGFKSLLLRLAGVWQDRRKDVEEQARILTEAIREQQARGKDASPLTEHPGSLASRFHQHFLDQFDARFGGFGDAPKFPPHSSLLLLLRTRALAPDRNIDLVIERTLDAMLRGGIYDQVGGGFHRYATDEHWLLPHFEKMLYDNALLLEVYARAATAFARPAYRRIVEETAAWLAREMTHPGGGFYAALDADSEGEEGKYYVWTHDELAATLDPGETAAFATRYRMLPGGNFSDEATGHPTGSNIPHLDESATEADIAALAPARAKLLAARRHRVPPGLDDKIIAGWNGLMIRALAVAARLLESPPLLTMALKARAFVEEHLVREGRIARSWCGATSPREGVLEDYAALALADAELYLATGDAAHLARARALTQTLLDRFHDPASDDVFMTARDSDTLFVRVKDLYDQGSPSGLGLAAQALVRVGTLADLPEWIATARRWAERHAATLQRMPSAVSSLAEGWLMADDPGTPAGWDLVAGREGLRIVATLPPDWYLSNVVFRRQDDLTTVELAEDPARPRQWIVTEPVRAHLAGSPLSIHYQPCSPTECRPVASSVLLLPRPPG